MGSIRSRLLVTLILAQLAAGLLSAWSAFYSSKNEFSRLLDSELEHIAVSVSRHGSTPLSELTLLGSDPGRRIIVQVYESRSNALFLSEDTKPLPTLAAKGFSDVLRDDGEWRVYTIPSGTEIITVAQPASVRTGLAVSSSFRVLQPLLFLLPMTAIAVWLIVGQGLAPLDRTARTVASRSPDSLAPIENRGLPFELNSLVNSINRLMKRLSESLDAQKNFASDAAHELRTPLTAIGMQARLLRRVRTPEAAEKCLSRLDEAVLRATRLIEQLLTMTRLDPDAASHPFREVGAEEIFDAVRREMEPIAAQKEISISVSCGEQGLACQGLFDSLLLLVTNLTDNAIKYTPKGGRLELSAAREGDRLLLRVSDNGSGIPEGDREKIFKRFYRALGTKVQGNGLGLAIAKRIVEIHHGTIQALDGLDGKGTTMEVNLPAHRTS